MKPFDRSSMTTSSTRACVIFPGALGDFICFLPALQALLRGNRVDLYTHSEFADIVPAGVTVRSLESAEISRLFVETTLRDSRLRDKFGTYAAVYSWLGSQQPVFVNQLQAVSDGRAKIFPFRPTATAEHQTEYYLRCLGLPAAVQSKSAIELRDEALRWCENFWTEHSLTGRAVLTIAPGSGAREKNWPEEFFLAVANWWRERTGGISVLLIGPVEAARGGIDRLSEHCLAVGDLRLSQAAALISRSAVYLGNDSGVSHLAAAVGVPTVALFGPSDPRQWAPRGGRVTVISRQIHCSPCSTSTMKSCPHRACLSELSAAQVIAVMSTLPELASLTRVGAGITV
jgi:ADP-heptose:LPS heptosyltransferase